MDASQLGFEPGDEPYALVMEALQTALEHGHQLGPAGEGVGLGTLPRTISLSYPNLRPRELSSAFYCFQQVSATLKNI